MQDIFRKTYTSLSDEQKAAVAEIKDMAQAIFDTISSQVTEGKAFVIALMCSHNFPILKAFRCGTMVKSSNFTPARKR